MASELLQLVCAGKRKTWGQKTADYTPKLVYNTEKQAVEIKFMLFNETISITEFIWRFKYLGYLISG
jgi:hypothetical protein